MPGRVLQGVVVSNATEKTVVVSVERRVMHPLYKKYIRRTKKMHAHDATNACELGDKVRIRECRPLSKTKHWEVISAADADSSIGAAT